MRGNACYRSAMKPFYRYARLTDECQCGSGHAYKGCCFKSELCGFIGVVLLMALTLLLPSGSWVWRIVVAILGVAFWLSVVWRIREWFTERRDKAGKQKHDENHVANTSVNP